MKWQAIIASVVEFFQSFTLPNLYREEELELRPIRIPVESQDLRNHR